VNQEGLARAVLDVPTPPCEEMPYGGRCPYFSKCQEGLACGQFYFYIQPQKREKSVGKKIRRPVMCKHTFEPTNKIFDWIYRS